VSRARRTSRGDRPALTVVPDLPPEQQCDCPACSGEEIDPEQMFDELLGSVSVLADADDPMDAELAGAALASTMAVAGDDMATAVVQGLIPQLEASPRRDALALLLALGSVDRGSELSAAATAAAGRLAASGVAGPRWAAELAEPVRVLRCVRLAEETETTSVLAGSFHRAGREHALLVFVDEQDCGAAEEILVLDGEHLPELLANIREDGLAEGLELEERALSPAEFRWYAQDALDSRAVHDEEDLAEEEFEPFDDEPLPLDDPDDEDDDAPPYAALALLLRTRLEALPAARKPAGARAHTHTPVADAPLTVIRGGFDSGRAPAPPKLPVKRKKSFGPAPVYQLKVTLEGSRPPIWRRLLVEADLSLATLHDAIQAAFGWQDSHLHVFQTAFGDFGHADRELGHRAEKPVNLEQVAPRAGDRLRYTYDFGDDWVHEIVVEKVLDRDPSVAYPTCTGGRRAAPPDDCGGIWGYDELREALADPEHPDHEERLEWMGLADPAEFDPAAFDPDEVNRALAEVGTRRR